MRGWGELVFYTNSASTKAISAKHKGKETSSGSETRSDPRTAKPQCIDERR